VFAVQEMDQFEEFWKPFFETNGYAGVWKRRTQGTAQKKDGCGLFYKRARYELLASKGIEYNDLAFGKECAGQDGCDDGFFLACAESQKNPTLETLAAASPENDASDAIAALSPDKKKHLRDCVGVLVVLREKSVGMVTGDGISGDGIPGGDGTVSGNEEIPVPTNENKNKPVVIASTHLFWDPAFPEVKLAQSERLLKETAGFADRFLAGVSPLDGVSPPDGSDTKKGTSSAGEKKKTMPVVIAGDFNSVPGSEVYQTATRGILGTVGRLKSAYKEALGTPGVVKASPGGDTKNDQVTPDTHGEPIHTNVTPNFTACIDYVFVSENVRVTSAEPIDGPASTFQGLPDMTHPSDHLPITVTVEF
jgi:CCR4-NOT transcription complex subunit 6|tara:strand:+ start:5940 stop:7031 length:1092 start_codon:yes stop_codon:yes gene_type:complete